MEEFAEHFRILMSVLLAVCISVLFKYTCTCRSCIIFKAPNPAEIKDNIYLNEGKCYKLGTEKTECTPSAILSK